MIEAAFFGILGRDAERKVSAKGKTYLRINVCLSEGEKTQWVGVTSFDERAIAAVDRLVKGARVYIEGRLSLDEWTAADGIKRHGLSVITWHSRLAEIGRNRPKRNSGAKNNSSAPTAPSNDLNDEIPF